MAGLNALSGSQIAGRSLCRILVLTFCFGVTTGGQVVDATNEQAAAPAQTAPAASAASKKYNNLHRCDFKLTGASCVACVRRVGRMIRGQKGVVKADISIFKPYWGIVIYDRDQTDMDKLYDVVKAAEKVKFEDLDDQKIAEVPLIIIPKGLKSDSVAASQH